MVSSIAYSKQKTSLALDSPCGLIIISRTTYSKTQCYHLHYIHVVRWAHLYQKYVISCCYVDRLQSDYWPRNCPALSFTMVSLSLTTVGLSQAVHNECQTPGQCSSYSMGNSNAAQSNRKESDTSSSQKQIQSHIEHTELVGSMYTQIFTKQLLDSIL